jgi:DNA mismatch endonuclease (patch repair protein)
MSENQGPPVDPKRSALMGRIGATDTSPEMAVRRAAHNLGYRYRLHRRDLPGTPDLVFPRLRKVILVHGCFWHRHEGCVRTTTPTIRRDFWVAKFEANVERDARVRRQLEELGWEVLVVWECETFDEAQLQVWLRKYLPAAAP